MATAEGAALRRQGADGRRLNALRHGILSREVVLPWEDEGAYRTLLAELHLEHRPEGATESHLVEELAGTIWRKRRLRLAEAALARQGIARTIDELRQAVAERGARLALEPGQAVVDALEASPEETWRELARPGAAERRRLLEDRISIRTAALGGAHDPAALQPLARYEVHLDRKLQRTLSTLFRLQQLKREREGR